MQHHAQTRIGFGRGHVRARAFQLQLGDRHGHRGDFRLRRRLRGTCDLAIPESAAQQLQLLPQPCGFALPLHQCPVLRLPVLRRGRRGLPQLRQLRLKLGHMLRGSGCRQ